MAKFAHPWIFLLSVQAASNLLQSPLHRCTTRGALTAMGQIVERCESLDTDHVGAAKVVGELDLTLATHFVTASQYLRFLSATNHAEIVRLVAFGKYIHTRLSLLR